MAIYKLGDIGMFKGGISTLSKEKYDSGVNFVNYMDIFNNFSINDNLKLRHYNANENEYIKYNLKFGDAIFTASSETPEEIAISSIYLSDKKAIFNGFSKRYRFNHNVLNPYFAKYLFRSNSFRSEAKKYATGYTRFNISQEDLKRIEVNIPPIKEQKIIIDIIEQNEKLFLKYNEAVRIDKFENTKKDINSLIDIIEPLEVLKNKNNLIKEKLLKIVKNLYSLNQNEQEKILNIANLKTQKYNDQLDYFATNSIKEFSIDYSKIQTLNKNEIPSRANLTVEERSIIISKLIGENKFFYFYKKPQEVFSTGFFNLKTYYVDHVIGFLLNSNWTEQKESLSNGTTMVGLNTKNFNEILIKKPFESQDKISNLIYINNILENKIEILINKIINVLII